MASQPKPAKGNQGKQSKKPEMVLNDNRGKQAVIVDYKAIACKSPGSGSTKPFIQYSLEWLLIEKFDEIYICCLPDNASQLRNFVEYFMRTENVPKSMVIQVHTSENNRSTGDCLRDLDSKGLIRTDFVIMDAGCCGNLPLGEILDSHKALKKVDKNAILTSIVRNLFTKNPAEIGEFPIYITDPKTGLLLHYKAGRVSESETGDDSLPRGDLKTSIQVPSMIFLERESVRVHTNLCSTNLSIYSVGVPALFAELFDCHSEAELIRAIFDNEEVLGGTVYINVVDDLFSQRMADFGFAINQKRDKFDTNLIYKRNERYQVLRKLVNDSLIDCTRLNLGKYLTELSDNEESESETESESDEMPLDDDEIFLSEVLDSLVRGYEETIENENLVLEVNSSKHAYNISICDVYSTIAKALLYLPDKLSSGKPTTQASYYNIVENSIKKFGKFLMNYIKNEESRETILAAIEELHLAGEVEHLSDTVLAKIIYKLYDVDILDEDSILSWYENFDSTDKSQKNLRARPAFKQLISALQAESEEEEDGDEDDD